MHMFRREFLMAWAAFFAMLAGPAYAKGFSSERISVTTVGTGPDVVLIPGLGSTREVWKELTAALPGYRYHLVQLNGFAGHAVKGNAGTGPVAAPVAHEIARYIRESGLEAPAVIGHSMGGTMGMMVAARHPETVGRLMVVDMLPFVGSMFGTQSNATPETLKPIAEAIRARMAAAKGEEQRKAVESTIATMIKTEGRRAEAVQASLASDSDVTSRAFAELIVTDLRPELARIKVPVTVLYVRAPNAPVTDEQMDGFYKASFANLPQAKLKRVADAWHFIMWDQPERFQAEVREFLAN
jgi:pimeloyl-ACP methyl ester carboxylesterase